MFDRPVQKRPDHKSTVQKRPDRSPAHSIDGVDPVAAAPAAAPATRGFSLADFAITAERPDRDGLPAVLKHGIEALSGIAMDDVRVHRNSARPAKVGALAYAQGSDIHVAPGQERHLPHEAWHVVQQKQGRVRATRQLEGGVAVNDHQGLEGEADMMGERAATIGGGATGPALTVVAAPPLVPVQRTVILEVAGGKKRRAKRKRAIEEDKSATAAAADEKVLKALEAGEQADERRAGVGAWAYTHLHKGSAELYSVEEALQAAEDDLNAADVVDMGDGQDWLMEKQPDSLVKLHQTVQHQVNNYAEWLRDDPTWAGRSDKDKERRARALQLMAATKAYLSKAQRLYPLINGEAHQRERSFKRNYDEAHQGGIDAQIDKIHRALQQIDNMVTEPPVPPKNFGDFKGDTAEYTYGDGKTTATAIPVIFYKQEANYAPIVVPNNPANRIRAQPGTYNFPHGPTVWRLTRPNAGFHLNVDDKYRFGKGTVLTNTKNSDIRAVQIDINKALVDAGVNMNNKDGDHVRDLGFGGADVATNYWPLDAHINRRPFKGWRTNYGLNYVSGEDHKTASITALAGKKLKIDDFMSASGGSVPPIGEKPDPESGAIGHATKSAPSRPGTPSQAGPSKKPKKESSPTSTVNKSPSPRVTTKAKKKTGGKHSK